MEYYPSISEELLLRTLQFARKFTTVPEQRPRHHPPRKEIAYVWAQEEGLKRGSDIFDVPLGCYDGAEVWELVGALALAKLVDVYNCSDMGYSGMMSWQC